MSQTQILYGHVIAEQSVLDQMEKNKSACLVSPDILKKIPIQEHTTRTVREGPTTLVVRAVLNKECAGIGTVMEVIIRDVINHILIDNKQHTISAELMAELEDGTIVVGRSNCTFEATAIEAKLEAPVLVDVRRHPKGSEYHATFTASAHIAKLRVEGVQAYVPPEEYQGAVWSGVEEGKEDEIFEEGLSDWVDNLELLEDGSDEDEEAYRAFHDGILESELQAVDTSGENQKEETESPKAIFQESITVRKTTKKALEEAIPEPSRKTI